jgi:nuclear transport factor 2 (NTF2) superfamily protein
VDVGAGGADAALVTARIVSSPDLWSFYGNRIAVRFQYESHNAVGQWYRSYGNELWEFDNNGYMRRREVSINNVPIAEADRRIFGPRPEAGRGQTFPLR